MARKKKSGRPRSDIHRAAEAYINAQAAQGNYPTTAEIVDRLMQTDVMIFSPKGLRALIAMKVRSVLLRKVDGERMYYPVMSGGVERWKPSSHTGAADMLDFLTNIDRPTLANHGRSNRRREVEMEILKNEARLAGQRLTVPDVMGLTDNAADWAEKLVEAGDW